MVIVVLVPLIVRFMSVTWEITVTEENWRMLSVVMVR